MTADVWYEDPDIVWEVANYAVDESLLLGVQEVLDYFEKPHHYGNLHDQYAMWAHLSDKADR